MGKAGRIACIFTPWAMTIVSLAILVVVELGGRSVGSSVLNDVYAWQADFSKLSVPSYTDDVGKALLNAKGTGMQNYCFSNPNGKDISHCTDQDTGFVFNPITAWHLDGSKTKRADALDQISKDVNNDVNSVMDQIKQLFGKDVATAIQTYETASKWMGIGFQVALWTSLATMVAGISAIFSRWGSFITWIFSTISSTVSFATSLTATVIFSVLVATLKEVLSSKGVEITIGTRFLALIWISTALSMASTSFWLFSACCCSGKSNPHHRSNRGGLWHGDEKGHYGPASRGLRVEQTGAYERVPSPYMGAEDRVPAHDYPVQQPLMSGPHNNAPSDAYEPYRYQK